MQGKVLYVAQREFCIVGPDSGFDFIASDGATSCFIVSVQTDAAVGLCHLDRGIDALIILLEKITAPVAVHCVGGTIDANGLLPAITELLFPTGLIYLGNYSSMSIHISTRTIYTSPLPRSVRVGYEVRMARLFIISQPVELHHTREGFIVIQPFAFSAMPWLQDIINLPDNILLMYTSSTPEIEDDDFCQYVRATLSCIAKQNSDDIFALGAILFRVPTVTIE
jgi:hypothetical protein